MLSKQNKDDSPYPNPSSSSSYQYSCAAGLKQPQPKSAASPPPQTPQLSVLFVTQSGSGSEQFNIQPFETSSKQNSVSVPEFPKPSPSVSSQYISAAGL